MSKQYNEVIKNLQELTISLKEFFIMQYQEEPTKLLAEIIISIFVMALLVWLIGRRIKKRRKLRRDLDEVRKTLKVTQRRLNKSTSELACLTQTVTEEQEKFKAFSERVRDEGVWDLVASFAKEPGED